MDIERPEIDMATGKAFLRMFCPEERYPREIYWAGFGFQVWCQMLTFITRSRQDSLLIIDEPDIYLHSDLQRQLVGLLREIHSDVLIATHSTEIISEADPGELLVINKKSSSAKRINDPSQLQSVFGALGSNLNPTLTQLAKSRRALFVEGHDFQILAAFARHLGKLPVANRSDFAVVQAEGFNPQKVHDLSKGIEITLGTKILKAVVFDRDYRSDAEVQTVRTQLEKFAGPVHIHDRKEIENYLLEPHAIDLAIRKQVSEHNKRSGERVLYTESAADILEKVSAPMKSFVSAQFITRKTSYEKSKNPEVDYVTLNQRALEQFEGLWATWSTRKMSVPGNELLSQINKYIQERFRVTITPIAIVSAMTAANIPKYIVGLITSLDAFRSETLP